MTIDNETSSKSTPEPQTTTLPVGPKVGKLIDMESPVHHPQPSSSEELRPLSQASSKSTSGVCSGESTHQGEQLTQTPGAATTPGTASTTGTVSTPGAEPGAESSGSMSGSHHTTEGQQTFNNQAFDGTSIIESEHATDVSYFCVLHPSSFDSFDGL